FPGIARHMNIVLMLTYRLDKRHGELYTRRTRLSLIIGDCKLAQANKAKCLSGVVFLASSATVMQIALHAEDRPMTTPIDDHIQPAKGDEATGIKKDYQLVHPTRRGEPETGIVSGPPLSTAIEPHFHEQATLFGHPVGLFTLFFAEMWERF